MPTDSIDKPKRPYKYLTHYGLGDQSIFCGREREIRSFVTDINTSPLVVLFAATGTGKTSLINAGVRPRLENWRDGERPPPNERRYVTYYIRVGEDPALSIRKALHEHPPIAALAAEAPLAPALKEVVKLLDRPIVLFLDQFEEFFLYNDPAHCERKKRFIADVAALYSDENAGVHLVLSMREEFLGKMDLFREEIPTIFHKDSQLRLGWFRREQAEEAIALPPQHFGVKLDDELVQAIMQDLLTDEGVEPAQLQIICHSLWKSREEDEKTLTVEHYRRLALGRDEVKLKGLAQLEDSFAKLVLGRRFEAELSGLQQKPALDTLAALLPELCSPMETKRIREVGGLASVQGIDANLLPEVAEYLESIHLVKLRESNSVLYIELSHDYLVKRMPALLARVRTLFARRILTAAMSAYNQTGELPRPEDLEEIFTYADELQFEEPQARLLLLAALEWDSHPLYWFRIAEQSGVKAWALIKDILNEHVPASDLARQSVLYLLSNHKPNDLAFGLLEKSLEDDDLAPTAIDALVNLKSEKTVGLLSKLLESGRHREETLNALKIISRARDQVAAKAAHEALERHKTITVVNKTFTAVNINTSEGDIKIFPQEHSSVRSSGSTHRTPPPFLYIRNLFKEGTVVPFVGAGINFGTRPAGASWHEGAPFLPSGAELSGYLAEVCAFPSEDSRDRSDLARVASYFEQTIGGLELRQVLRHVSEVEQEPGAVHNYLATSPAPLLILTTNFDDVLERAFQQAGKPFDIVTHRFSSEEVNPGEVWWQTSGSNEPIVIPSNRLDINLSERSVIYKLTGSFNRSNEEFDSYAITEDDYIDMFGNLLQGQGVPPLFLRHIRSRPLLFLGIGLENWYMRALLRALRGDSSSNSRSWAILYRPSAYTARLWESKGVQVYDMSVEEFVRNIREEH